MLVSVALQIELPTRCRALVGGPLIGMSRCVHCDWKSRPIDEVRIAFRPRDD